MESPGLEEFSEEVDEILQDLEQGILQLEAQPRKKSLVDRIFRNMHTIKGGAGMVMQTELADYAHRFENLLDRVRSGEIICSPEMATLLLDALDGLNCFMDRIRGTGDLNQELIDRTLKQIGEFESGVTPANSTSDKQKSEQKLQQVQASAEVTDKGQDIVSTKSEEQSVWDDEEEDEKG